MDSTFRPENRPWISSTPIDLRSYFDRFSDVLKQERAGRRVVRRGDLRSVPKVAMIQLMGAEKKLDEETLQQVEEMCSLDHLNIPNELSPMTNGADSDATTKFRPLPIPPEGLQTLHTLELQQMFLDKANNYARHRRLKHSIHQPTWMQSMPPPPTKVSPKILDAEIMVTVRVYRPMRGPDSTESIQKLGSAKYSQEIQLLGRNKLSELRDQIKCVSDLVVPGDVSDNPDAPRPKAQKTKEIYRSGFIYIEGCFYNDTRWPECIDYSAPIRTWSLSRKKLGPFSMKKMEETKVEDLVIRLGYPYVYVHQGNHEHLLVFLDARLMSVDDDQRPSSYPRDRSVALQHSRYCMVCSVNVVKWITKEHTKLPEDPFFFCDECFRKFNYDSKGRKLGTFKAFPVVDVNAI